MKNKIITPQEALGIKNKPWLPDIEQLQGQVMLEINKAVHYTMAADRLERMLLKTDMLIRFGEFDEAFEVSAYATQNPTITINTVNMITEMWHNVLVKEDALSEGFVDNNEELCKNVIAMLERVKKDKALNNKTCNEIINRLNKKKGDKDDVKATDTDVA